MKRNGRFDKMTLLETLDALKEGKKITTQKWLDNRKIKSIKRPEYPEYIEYNPTMDTIVDDKLRPVRYLYLTQDYIIYDEPMLNADEKSIILMLLSYIDYNGPCKLYVKKYPYGIVICDEYENIANVHLGFEGMKESCKFNNLKNEKSYYLKELGIDKDIKKETEE